MFSGLGLSHYPAGTQEGFPRRRLTSVLRNMLMEVPVCADNLSVALFSDFAASGCRKIPVIRCLFL
ncbi:hypothetical protein DK853_15065 [Klebsiella oxytoca]|nr:hypothetical protein DK853_15065 [Klebsiella oxytoca]